MEEKIWEQLKTVFDPEIPVNVVDLGLIYSCRVNDRKVDIEMTLTAPGCGMSEVLREDARRKVLAIPGVDEVDVHIVWDPPWDPSRMSDAARLLLGWM